MDSELIESILDEGEADGLVFEDEDLSGRDLSTVIFRNCSFISCDLECTSFSRGGLMSSSISDSDLSRADFSGAYIKDSEIVGSRLYGTVFSSSRIKNAGIVRSSARYSSFSSASASLLRIEQSSFTDSAFDEMKCTGCIFSSSDFSRSSFRGTSMNAIDLHESSIESIALSEDFHELRGARLDITQMMCIAALLSVEIV